MPKIPPKRKKGAMIIKNLHIVNTIEKNISKLIYRQNVDYNLSLRVLGGSVMLQGDWLSTMIKIGKEPQFQYPKFGLFSAGIFKFWLTYSLIYNSYFYCQNIYTLCKYKSGKTGNQHSKYTKICQIEQLLISGWNFVGEQHFRKVRVTC